MLNTKFFLCSFHLLATLSPITNDHPPEESATITVPLNEISALDTYIEISTEALTNAKALKEMIKEYQQIQERYFENNEDRETALEMIKSACRIRDNIDEHHLTQLFPKDFMRELTLFSNMATKRGVPSP